MTALHVEDLRDIQFLKQQLRIPGLEHTEVVKGQSEIAAGKLLRELANEGDEDLSVDGSRMDREVDEASVQTDGSNER